MNGTAAVSSHEMHTSLKRTSTLPTWGPAPQRAHEATFTCLGLGIVNTATKPVLSRSTRPPRALPRRPHSSSWFGTNYGLGPAAPPAACSPNTSTTRNRSRLQQLLRFDDVRLAWSGSPYRAPTPKHPKQDLGQAQKKSNSSIFLCSVCSAVHDVRRAQVDST